VKVSALENLCTQALFQVSASFILNPQRRISNPEPSASILRRCTING
jgi:hypothetical protein